MNKKVNISAIKSKMHFIYKDEREKNIAAIVIYNKDGKFFFDPDYKNEMSNLEVEALLLRGALVDRGGKYYRPSSFNENNVSFSDAVINPEDIEVDLSGYALKEDIPNKVSQLTNDSNFVTESEVEDMIENEDFATKTYVDSEIQERLGSFNGGTSDLSAYALKEDIPNKVSQLTNDSNFVTESEVEDMIDSHGSSNIDLEEIERITKEEINRQIADGTIANLSIQNDSITSDKIKWEEVKDVNNIYVSKGLVLDLNCRNMDSQTIIDKSKNNYNMTLTDFTGEIGEDYINFNDKGYGLIDIPETAIYTLEFVIDASTYSGRCSAITTLNYSSSAGLSIYTGSPTAMNYGVNGTGRKTLTIGSNFIPLNEKVHIVVTYDTEDKRFKFYKNTELFNTSDVITDFNPLTTKIGIGLWATNFTSEQDLLAKVYMARAYNRTLTQEEVINNFINEMENINGEEKIIKAFDEVYPITRAEAVYVNSTETLSEYLPQLVDHQTYSKIIEYVDLPYMNSSLNAVSLYVKGSNNDDFSPTKINILVDGQNVLTTESLNIYDYIRNDKLYRGCCLGIITSGTFRSESEGFADFVVGGQSYEMTEREINSVGFDIPSDNREITSLKCNIFKSIAFNDSTRTEGISQSITNSLVISINKNKLDGNGTLQEQFNRYIANNNIKIIRKFKKPIVTDYPSTIKPSKGSIIDFEVVENYCPPSMVKVTGYNEAPINVEGDANNDHTTNNYYNQQALYIPTPCGYNQPYHPSVIYIKDGFSGYNYWMCQTAYPIGAVPYRDRWENPSIYASHDGVNWIVPEGLVNPIDDITPEEEANNDYLSDPHLVYREDLKRLEVYYRITHVDLTQEFRKDMYPTWILRKTSTDGVNWTDRETLIDLQAPTTNGVGDMVRSHAVIWQDGKYKMWYVNMLAGQSPRLFVYAESLDGYTWVNKQYCNVEGYIEPWHMDVLYAKGQYHLLSYVQDDNVYYYVSDNGIDFKLIKEIVRPCGIPTSYYSKKLYRSCMVYDEDNDMWLVYFSAETETDTKIGLMMGKSPTTLQVVDGGYIDRPQYFGKGIEIVNTSKIKNEIKLTDKGTCIGVDYDTERVYIKKSDGTKFYIDGVN